MSGSALSATYAPKSIPTVPSTLQRKTRFFSRSVLEQPVYCLFVFQKGLVVLGEEMQS